MARAHSTSSMNKILLNHEAKYASYNQQIKNYHMEEFGYLLDPLLQSINKKQKFESRESAEKFINEKNWICEPRVFKIHARPDELDDRFHLQWNYPMPPTDMKTGKRILFLFSISQMRRMILFKETFPKSQVFSELTTS